MISKKTSTFGRPVVIINLILVVIEMIAFIHDCIAFGMGMFKWYTIDSNVLQLIISAFVLYYCAKERPIPGFITRLHFVSAVGLTITFLIAAFVLAPEGGIRYYFLDNVAPINHLIAPALSVVSLLFLEKTEKQPLHILIWPMAASLSYGVICLILNAVNKLDGPYFFLQVHKQPAGVIIMWFGIIAVLCLVLSFVYYVIKWKKNGNNK